MSAPTLSPSIRRRFTAALAGALALALLGPGTAVRAQGFGSWTDIFLPESQEKALAEQEHPKVLSQFGGAYEEPALNAYVQSLVDYLGQTSNRPDITYRVTILNSPIVNAFALPAGYVYVTRGLLALADSEAELAGVMAHEIGHVTARHTAQRYGQAVAAQTAVQLLGAAGLGQMGKLAEPLAMLGLTSFSRDHEFEADLLGIETMARAGFDPYAMATFLERLDAKTQLDARLSGQPSKAGAGFDLLSTHPRTPERVQRAIAQADVTHVRDPMAAREIYLRKIDGMLYGDDPAQGFVRGRLFAHPELDLRFEVPEGFQLLNGQEAVIARGPNGATIKFDAAQRAGGSVLGYLRDVWAKDLPLKDAETIRINGFRAATGRLEAQIDGKAKDLRLVAIDAGGPGLYRFQFSSPAPTARELETGFIRTAYSFDRLTAAERRELKPYRLITYEARQGDTVESLASWLPFDSDREARFRVLNGLGPRGQIQPGRVVKLIRE